MGGPNSKFRASPGAGNQPGALQGARAERTVTPTGIESEKARFPTVMGASYDFKETKTASGAQMCGTTAEKTEATFCPLN